MDVQDNGGVGEEAGEPSTWRQKVLPACFVAIATVYFTVVFLVFLSLLLKPVLGR